MNSIGIISSSIACGIFGFLAGVYFSALYGLHEKTPVMSIGISAAVVTALLCARLSRKLIAITPRHQQVPILYVLVMSGPLGILLLIRVVGY